MNSHCSVCDVEKDCGYEYKPCDCCNYRKFKPKPPELRKEIEKHLFQEGLRLVYEKGADHGE